MGLRAWVRRLLSLGRAHPRVVRRTTVHCPRSGQPVEIELLMKETGGADVVLRCSARPGTPPDCDQACRALAEAVVGRPRAVIICPPGKDLPEEVG